MIASPRSLERMIDRRLRRWGLIPRRRSNAVFICSENPLKLNLGSFFSVFRVETELLTQDPSQPVMGVLQNRIKRFTDASTPWKNYVADEKKAALDKKNEAQGALDEVLDHVSKLRVSVK